EQADDILGFSLSQLCFEGPVEALNDTINTQVAIFTTSVAALHALRAAGYEIIPKYVAGHSLGEYSAYVAAGALSFEDGLRLVRTRGTLMKKAGELNPGSMAALLKLDDETVEKICADITGEGSETVQIANYNSPGQVVISGHNAAIDQGIERALEAKARKAVKLAVSIAAHSELMRVIADEFREAINTTSLNLPEMPIIANISGEPLSSLEDIRAEMEGQLTSSVRWTDSVLWMADNGITEFVEIGPTKSVLGGLNRRIIKTIKTHLVGNSAEIDTFLASKA
ncbi:MAG: ACP S-malonyltransferase, partial [Chloroflexota bacterium]